MCKCLKSKLCSYLSVALLWFGYSTRRFKVSGLMSMHVCIVKVCMQKEKKSSMSAKMEMHSICTIHFCLHKNINAQNRMLKIYAEDFMLQWYIKTQMYKYKVFSITNKKHKTFLSRHKN